ncbi:MAG: DUF131 domain-containing protein [Nitrososphaerota archaeon]|nr:DUF131 domain-containing protein [Nitrososphaerota archaeon]
MASAESGHNVKTRRVEWFLSLFFIGFFIILVGIVLLVAAALLSEGSASFGGFVLIGPFPIVFGAGPAAPWLVLFAIILGVLTVAFLFLMWKRGEGRL